MGRFGDISEDEGENDIDISPLIDCVFILLIFFIVTTVFVEEPGVEVERPQALASRNLEKNSILIALTDGGDIVYGKRQIRISDVRPLVKRLTNDEQMPVIIQADREADSGVLVKLIGEAKAAGAEVVSVAAETPQG